MAITQVADPYGGTDALKSSAGIIYSPVFAESDDYTVMLWHYVDPVGSLSTTSYSLQFPYRGGTFIIQYDTGLNKTRMNWNGSPGFLEESGTTILDNVWTHIALTVSDGSFKVYRNGVELFSGVASPGTPNDFRFFMGSVFPSTIFPNDRYFDICFSDRAFTATEIAWYYADRLTNGANSLPPGD